MITSTTAPSSAPMLGWMQARPARLHELLGEATAHRLRLQFGDAASMDLALRDMVERRLRIGAWHRAFLRALGEALGPDLADAGATLARMSAHQAALADTSFAMDRRAKEVEIARRGPDAIDDPAAVNRIGQSAALHAHTRSRVEALAATRPREG